MKHDCDIVRDLMPMCVDGTASDKARRMVEEHVEECPPCGNVYAEMRREATPEVPLQPARTEFADTVRRMKKRRKRRTWLTLLLGVVIAAALAWCGCYAYYWYFLELVPLEEAQLSVVRTSDGLGLIHAANVPEGAVMDIAYDRMSYPEAAKGQHAGYVFMKATRHEARNAAADVYFVVGSIVEDRLVTGNDWGQDTPVYRMQLNRADGSGRVFYQFGEEEIESVSLRGLHLKTAGRNYTYTTRSSSPVIAFATPTPAQYTQDGDAFRVMASPTPLPTITPWPTDDPAD